MIKYLIEDTVESLGVSIKINIGSTKAEESPMTVAFQRILFSLYEKLPKGFYLPEHVPVVAPGSYLTVSLDVLYGYYEIGNSLEVLVASSSDPDNVRKLVFSKPITGSFSYSFKIEKEYILDSGEVISPPFNLIFRLLSQNREVSSYIVYVRNYAVPLYIQSYLLLKYVYIPLHMTLISSYNFFVPAIKDFIDYGSVADLLSLPLDYFPISSEYIFRNEDNVFDNYFGQVNPFDSVFGKCNLSYMIYKSLLDIYENKGIEEAFDFVLKVSTYYILANQFANVNESASIEYYTKLMEIISPFLFGNFIEDVRFGLEDIRYFPVNYSLPFVSPKGNTYEILVPQMEKYVPDGNYINLLDRQPARLSDLSGEANKTYYLNFDINTNNYVTVSLSSQDSPDDLGFGRKIVKTDIEHCARVEFEDESHKNILLPGSLLYVKANELIHSLITLKSFYEVSYPKYLSALTEFESDIKSLPVVYVVRKAYPILSYKKTSSGVDLLFSNDDGSQFFLCGLEGVGKFFLIDIVFKYDRTLDENDKRLLEDVLNILTSISEKFQNRVSSIWIRPLCVENGKYKLAWNIYNQIVSSNARYGAKRNNGLMFYRSLKEWMNFLK